MGIAYVNVDNKVHELLSFIQFLGDHKYNSFATLTSIEITPAWFKFRQISTTYKSKTCARCLISALPLFEVNLEKRLVLFNSFRVAQSPSSACSEY